LLSLALALREIMFLPAHFSQGAEEAIAGSDSNGFVPGVISGCNNNAVAIFRSDSFKTSIKTNKDIMGRFTNMILKLEYDFELIYLLRNNKNRVKKNLE